MSNTKRVLPKKPCNRCGHERTTVRNTPLCRDCRSVLNANERKAWT